MNTSPFKSGDRVVAYCRYSEGDEQGLKNQSTEEQADAIRRFCEENGLQLVRVFADPFASGRSVARRDHYLEMLSFLLHKKKPDVQGVVLWDFERYGRNYDQAQLDAARLRMAGYKLFSLQQPITDDSPFAHVLEAMYFASAQNQSDMISADVKRALQHNFQTYKVIPRSCIGWAWMPEEVSMGVYSDGSPRIGYRAVPDPEKVQLVRLAIRRRLAGASSGKCRELLGLSSSWAVKRLFANPLLVGRMTYGGTTIDDYCEPIIDRETFDALTLFERTAHTRRIGRQGGWSADPPMLSGLLYCAECGGPMYIYRRKSKGHLYRSYYCERSCFSGVKQDVLEDLVIRMSEEILSPENIRHWIDIMTEAETKKATEDLTEQLTAELKSIDRKLSKVMELLVSHPSDALAEKVQELDDRRKDLQGRLKTLSEREEKGFDAETLYKSTLELSARILAVLKAPDASSEAKRNVLQIFVRSILINADRTVVVNYIAPQSCMPNAHRPDKKTTDHDEVVSHDRLFRSAPPEVEGWELQHIGRLPIR